MLIILPYLQLAASHAGCYGLQGRFISKNSLFSYSDDISSRYPGMLKDILSCIRLLTDLRSKIHQYVPCGIPCNAHLETCGFSPALAGVENATAVAVSHDGLKSCGSRMGLSAICFANRDKSPSGASRSTKGALRIFPSFSWTGKCDSRERSESERRRCVADFPRLQLEWKMRQQGAKRVGAPKVRCGFSPASAGMENATAGSEASRSTEGALRIFPGFSWNGKCDSREQSESERRRSVIPANSRAEEGHMREFPGFSRFGTNRSGLLASDPPLPLRTSQLYNRPSCRRAWLMLRQVFACGKSLLCCERP